MEKVFHPVARGSQCLGKEKDSNLRINKRITIINLKFYFIPYVNIYITSVKGLRPKPSFAKMSEITTVFITVLCPSVACHVASELFHGMVNGLLERVCRIFCNLVIDFSIHGNKC